MGGVCATACSGAACAIATGARRAEVKRATGNNAKRRMERIPSENDFSGILSCGGGIGNSEMPGCEKSPRQADESLSGGFTTHARAWSAPEAILGVIVHHAHRLHPRIDNRRTHKLEAATLQLF